MSYFFEFNSAHGIFLVRFEGQVSDEEFQEYYRVAGEHMVRLHPRATISDYSAVTDLQVSVDTLRNLAHSHIAMPASNPRLVVAPAPHIYGLARMFQMEAEPSRPNLHVVSTLAEAFAHLKVETPKFEPLSIA